MLWHSRNRTGRIDPRGKETVIGWLYLALPFVSVLVHVYSAGWVYAVPFLNAYLAPVLLGLAIGVVAFWPAAATHTSRFAASGILAAVLLSAEFPWKLVFSAGGMLISPLRLMLLASLLTSQWCVWRHRRWAFASCGVACLAGVAWGRRCRSCGTTSCGLSA